MTTPSVTACQLTAKLVELVFHAFKSVGACLGPKENNKYRKNKCKLVSKLVLVGVTFYDVANFIILHIEKIYIDLKKYITNLFIYSAAFSVSGQYFHVLFLYFLVWYKSHRMSTSHALFLLNGRSQNGIILKARKNKMCSLSETKSFKSTSLNRFFTCMRCKPVKNGSYSN